MAESVAGAAKPRRAGFPRPAPFYVSRPDYELQLASALRAGPAHGIRVVVVCALGGSVRAV
jgi:hypothetical protein